MQGNAVGLAVLDSTACCPHALAHDLTVTRFALEGRPRLRPVSGCWWRWREFDSCRKDIKQSAIDLVVAFPVAAALCFPLQPTGSSRSQNVRLIRRSSQAILPNHTNSPAGVPVRDTALPAMGDVTANLASRHRSDKRTLLMSVIGFVDMNRPLCGVIMRVDCRGRRD